jgi:hypothetical protein
MITKPDFYFHHHMVISVMGQSKASLSDKLKLIKNDGIEHNLYHFFIGNKIDSVDAFGKYYTFNIFALLFFCTGVIISLVKRRKSHMFFLFSLLFFLMPCILTSGGIYRRSVLTIVLLYFFFAVSLNFLLNEVWKKYKIINFSLLVFLILFTSYTDMKIYFLNTQRDVETKVVFCSELTRTCLFLNEIADKDSKILFFSSRWSCKYEIPRFINYDKHFEDRSAEFGCFTIDTEHKSNVIFVLLNEYVSIIDEIIKKYPRGDEYLVEDAQTGQILGVIYKI